MLILKYERLDFFNHRIYTEDKKKSFTREDLKKVFAYFSKTHDASIQINNAVVFWDCLTEHENRIVTVRYYDGMNYDESKKSFDKVKKECYAMRWQIRIDSDGLLLRVYNTTKAMSLTLVAFLFWDLNGDMAVYVYSACIFAPGCFVSLLYKL